MTAFRNTLALLLLITLVPSFYQAQTKTRILILGTPHLSQIQGFEKEALGNVLRELEAFDFDAIAIESMPTELLNDIASRQDSTYSDLLRSFGQPRMKIQEKYQENMGLTLSQTHRKINFYLRKDSLSHPERTELLRLFLAAGDIPSAVLQYNYLNAGFFPGENAPDSAEVSLLNRLSNSPNEIYSLAMELARKEGLQQLEPIDNLQDEPLLLANFPEFISDYMVNQELFAEIPNLAVFRTIDSLQASGLAGQDFLPLYRYMNSQEFQVADYEAQWKLWLTTNFDSGSDLSRYALWEMRNLQIVANITRLAAFYPKKKILVIIGASHKSYLEKHLKNIPSFELMDFSAPTLSPIGKISRDDYLE